jgi:hypothetical protein
MPVPVRASTLGWTRPLPVPSRGRDGEEVVRPSSAMGLRQEEGIVADLGLSIRPGLLSLAGPRSFGPLLADMLRAAWPAN